MVRTTMRWAVVGWLLALTLPALADTPDSTSADEKTAGFESLFNGNNLDGWQHNGNWKVEGGVLTRGGKGGSLTYRAQKMPDDFELRFEWKVAKGSNSGVYYRPGQYEYQILDNKHHGDGRNPRTSAASLYFCMAPAKDATKAIGEWNSARIVCKGTVIQHWLNGVKVIDFDYSDPRWAKEVELLRVRGGKLADRGAYLNLQDHGDPVWYRNLRLRTIPADEKLVSENIQPAAIPAASLKYEAEFVKRATTPKKAKKK